MVNYKINQEIIKKKYFKKIWLVNIIVIIWCLLFLHIDKILTLNNSHHYLKELELTILKVYINLLPKVFNNFLWLLIQHRIGKNFFLLILIVLIQLYQLLDLVLFNSRIIQAYLQVKFIQHFLHILINTL